MPKLRVIYIGSLLILGVVLIFTVFRPMVSGEKFSEVTGESIIETGSQWIIQFAIVNHEDKETTYIINWSTGGEVYTGTSVSLKPGRTYTHIHHVHPDTAQDGQVNLTIHKEGEAIPFEDNTYFVRFD